MTWLLRFLRRKHEHLWAGVGPDTYKCVRCGEFGYPVSPSRIERLRKGKR